MYVSRSAQCVSADVYLTFWPIVEHMLCDVTGRFAGAEEELFRFATDEDQLQVYLKQT